MESVKQSVAKTVDNKIRHRQKQIAKLEHELDGYYRAYEEIAGKKHQSDRREK